MNCPTCKKPSSYEFDPNKKKNGLIGVIMPCGCYVDYKTLEQNLSNVGGK